MLIFDYQSSCFGILRNKAYLTRAVFQREGKFLCHLVFQFVKQDNFLLKIVRVSCFVDYQSSSTGILRHKASSEDSFGNEGKFLSIWMEVSICFAVKQCNFRRKSASKNS